MSGISVIIRTKNEEKWIPHCLKMVFGQKEKPAEVILVDNQSVDHTLEVAKRFPITKTLQISDFKPGQAINAGIQGSTGKFIVCLSAHCVPQNDLWLMHLKRNFEDAAVAGVYGRQLPVAFSEPSDKRDLLITFGLDRRVQVKDYFFHNANSMIRRDVWEKINFDPAATNIEDRIWGKAVTEAGYKLVYEPEAAVYHHHGIHQDNNPQRARSVVSVLERFEKDAAGLPESLRAENANVAAVLPVLGEVREIGGRNLLKELIDQLKASKYVKSVHVFAENEKTLELARNAGAKTIRRPEFLLSGEKTVEDVLKHALAEIEKQGDYPDVVLSANYRHPFRPPRLFDEMVEDLQLKGLDAVFAGYTDYQNVWVTQPDGGYLQVGEGLKTREHKEPLYEALYGVGCATAAHVVRSGRIVGGRIGILPLADRIYTLKQVDERSERLISGLLKQFGTTV